MFGHQADVIFLLILPAGLHAAVFEIASHAHSLTRTEIHSLEDESLVPPHETDETLQPEQTEGLHHNTIQ